MKYTIIGLGFLSTHIAEYLSNYGEVVVTYRNLERVKKTYSEILQNKVKLVKLDPLSDIDNLRKLISSSDVVINTVGVIGNNESELKIAHIEIPRKISEIVSETSKPTLIHISAASASGLTGNVKEENKHCKGISPKLPYEITKCEGEKIVFSKARENNFPLAIIRPTFIYGKYSAHIHFVLMYWLAKFGIIPSFDLSISTISAKHIAMFVKVLSESKPKEFYMYASECKLVKLDKFFELIAEALGRKSIKIPIKGTELIPSSLKCALKYAGTTYDCSKGKELIKDLEFDENEVKENELFMDELRKKAMLFAT